MKGQVSSKSLTDEIIHNARNDRRRLEAVANGLERGFGQLNDNSGDEGGIDPEVAAAFAEEIAKVSDSLTKINQQLVELVKLENKREVEKPKATTKLSVEEKEELYEELQGAIN